MRLHGVAVLIAVTAGYLPLAINTAQRRSIMPERLARADNQCVQPVNVEPERWFILFVAAVLCINLGHGSHYFKTLLFHPSFNHSGYAEALIYFCQNGYIYRYG